ncbi:NACHT, LRR and PYD domains-containing protein 2 [Orycteropus afer afer]|uniref:NACHT, LRR and PYD domains-containing protein 2 n=1 Tax=Orycteropus afer afer TaxID=1230840 RepID=A0A8B7BCE0_ORYAF|nr:NACHT, LRR and PYD domains-containing protein 2 [Orycteropus afer afer]
MASPDRLDFNLQGLLEELDQEELSRFKSTLKSLRLRSTLHAQEFPQIDMDEADGKQLAEILINRCSSYWVEVVTMQTFAKMDRTDLCERAKEELREAALKSLQEKLSSLKLMQVEEDLINLEADMCVVKRRLGKSDKYRIILKEKFRQMWKANFNPGAMADFHIVTQRYKPLIPFCDPKTLMGPFPSTVVLLGPAGVGKSTLAKKVMLDWTENNLAKTFTYVFYLRCKELNKMGPCTGAELITKDCPELKDSVLRVLAQAQNVLFIIDGFDELRVPPGALIRDLCSDWETQKPVPILLSSLLNRTMFPRATLMVTTRPWALRELRFLVERPLLIEMEGFLEVDRKMYFLKHFQDEDQALQAFNSMRSNEALFSMASAPMVCWVICACLKSQMEKGEDPTPTCQTTTSLFLRFLCNQFTPGSESCLQAPVKALCPLAAEGVWTQTSVFDGEDLERLGVKESELSPFLEKDILQKDRYHEGWFSFIHLSVQQFLAAMFYVVRSKEDEESHSGDIGSVQELLSTEQTLENPSLTQVGYFLFGLLNESRARQLETTFGCRASLEVRRALLEWCLKAGGDGPFSVMDVKEALFCLYESQEEAFVGDAMAHFKELFLDLRSETDIVCASFCVKHCRNLQKMSLTVRRRTFGETEPPLESDAQAERSQKDQHMLPFWMDLCSVFGSNKNLTSLDISQSFLSNTSLRVICENVASATHSLQKVVLNNISPADAYRDFCLAFSGQETLTHLTLQGNGQNDMLPLLSEVLRHAKCNLQYLRLESCSATMQQWGDLFWALEINQSLTCLNLTANELLDEGVKLLCATLKHPRCSLKKLSLESCQLTEACCKDLSSALIINQKLTHLCLAENELRDIGVSLLCVGLCDPNCKLQTLVLWNCGVTDSGCDHLSNLLQQNSNLTHLDLGLNRVGITGLNLLCEALKEPTCNLKCLWLWGCSIMPFSCMDLSSALKCNRSLTTLDLGQNSLGHSGIKKLCEALKCQNCPLRKLRLKLDESDIQVQKLLQEIKDINPQLTVENDYQDLRMTRPSSHDFLF